MPRNLLRFAPPVSLCLALLAAPGVASAEPAPPGAASATGLQLGELLGLSTTGAQATSTGAGSEASAASVGGEPLLGLGGAQSDEGRSSGALVHVEGDGGPVVEVAPWEASATSTPDGTRSAASRAALVRGAVPSVADAHVVESESEASHTDSRSRGAGVSNGARLGLFDAVRLTLLHSEVSSSGEASSHLLGINDAEIGTDEQLSGGCALSLNPLASLICLTATGGKGTAGAPAGGTSGSAGVLDADSPLLRGLLGGVLDGIAPVSAFSVTGGAGAGSSPLVPAPSVSGSVPGASGSAAAIEAPRAAADPADRSGIGSALARTGGMALGLLPWGLAALGVGAGFRVLGARRRVLA